MKKILIALLLIFCQLFLFAQAYEGYTFYAPQNGTKAYLVDMDGNTYHSWTFSTSQKTTYSSYLLEGGSILRNVNHMGNSFSGGPMSGEVQIVDWNGNIAWDFVYSTSTYCTHHDLHMMPNGNVLLIAYELKSPAEVTQAGCSQNIEMWPDKIVEVQPSGTNGGNIVWEWHAWDHLCQSFDNSKDNYVESISDHSELMNINYATTKDWIHMNGIDYNPELDQITFSSHSLNEIYIIDHSTTTEEAASHSGGNSGKGGDILYRWGNPAAYNTSGTTYFNVVHDAHWIAADCPRFANCIAGFNNKGGVNGKTCVDIINPPYSGYNYAITAGTAYEPSTYLWRTTYTGNPIPDNGNSQQLPNGNMLITIGLTGYIYEIDSLENTVWSKNAADILAQAFRYTAEYIEGTSGIIELPNQFSVYPVPSSGLIHIETNIQFDESQAVNISDICGKTIAKYSYSRTLNLSAINSGIYFLSIIKKDGSILTRKIVIN